MLTIIGKREKRKGCNNENLTDTASGGSSAGKQFKIKSAKTKNAAVQHPAAHHGGGADSA